MVKLVIAFLFALCATAEVCAEPFRLVWEKRFLFDNEIPLADGTYLPAAHYSAEVTSLPAAFTWTLDGKEIASFLAPTNLAPPYTLHTMIMGRSSPALYVTKGGETKFVGLAQWPEDFEPRRAEYRSRLVFGTNGGACSPRVSLSAGTGQADVRFVTRGRQNRLYWEGDRLFFTFSVRSYGSCLGVMSFNPDKNDFRLEGIILFDYGDGLLRNDLAADLFFDEEAGEWRAYVSNFSTGADRGAGTSGRRKGGINVAWSKSSPLHGVSLMKAKSLDLAGMNEDPDGFYDEVAGEWRLLISAFGQKHIHAQLLSAKNWDGLFKPITGRVAEDSTGTTLAWIDGRLRALTGSAERALYVYDYPTMKKTGCLQIEAPPWRPQTSMNARVWPAYAELPDGRRLLLTFDRVNFKGMPLPNWTYGKLMLYSAKKNDIIVRHFTKQEIKNED